MRAPLCPPGGPERSRGLARCITWRHSESLRPTAGSAARLGPKRLRARCPPRLRSRDRPAPRPTRARRRRPARPTIEADALCRGHPTLPAPRAPRPRPAASRSTGILRVCSRVRPWRVRLPRCAQAGSTASRGARQGQSVPCIAAHGRSVAECPEAARQARFRLLVERDPRGPQGARRRADRSWIPAARRRATDVIRVPGPASPRGKGGDRGAFVQPNVLFGTAGRGLQKHKQRPALTPARIHLTWTRPAAMGVTSSINEESTS
jgi:hypothetical protein